MKHTKGILSLNNYHYPHAYLVIRTGSEDNDAFPRFRKICDVTLDGKTEEEYKANAEYFVKCWNGYDSLKQSHADLLEALIKYGDHYDSCAVRWSRENPKYQPCDCGIETIIAKAKELK